MQRPTQPQRLMAVFSCVALYGCGDSGSGDEGSGDGLVTSPTAGSPEAAGGGAAAIDTGSNSPAGAPGGTVTPPGNTGDAPSGTGPEATAAGGSGGTAPANVPQSGSAGRGEAGTAGSGSGQAGGLGGNGGEPSEPPATAGTPSAGGSAASADGCPAGEWPEADPSMPGPFEVATEEEVGPEAGEPEEDGTVPRFTLFRPEDMEQSGLCHPVITWGNGTGSTPNLYGGLLRHLSSHGFVVIGSNSTNVSRGEPRPMNVGIDWVLEQNQDPTSALYQRIDTAHIGATGHSQGAIATTQASGDERIVTSLPIEGAGVQPDLHGPAMFFCGGQDDVVSCDGAVRALEAITTLPAMYANYLTADHGSWLSFGGNSRTDVEIAITAWMRVHLMADQALRPWFYGESCGLCTDAAWEVDRKNMDQ